ncbi:MAG: hypothetical protein C0520_07125 [Sphingopyxis sp.]|nr:hypothetical protein [Sphingopyxis sp.]
MATWMIVAALSAAQPAATEPADIVVTGERDRARRSENFVDAIVQPSAKGQLARFEDPLCPASIGLAGGDGATVERRLRRVAEAARIRTAGPGCRTNLVILVVDDRAKAIAHWQKSRPDFFEGLTRREIDALANGDEPVAAWQILALKGADRRPVGRTQEGIVDYTVHNQVVPTRIGSTIQFEFHGAFLLVEASALGDMTLMQLADYAAMRTLARTDAAAAGAQPAPTILSLFDAGGGADAPPSLTHWDLGFLTALYRIDPAFDEKAQRRAIAHIVREQVAKAPDAEPRE